MYALARQLLFALPPELAHDLALGGLDLTARLGLARVLPARVADPCSVLGLRFANRVGLAAGLDKNADHLPGLAAAGFGFLELGTVTPRPQPGNDKPRLFRLPSHRALINRLGFNNAGVDHLVGQIQQTGDRLSMPLGVNIGKNRDTPLERAADDYCRALNAVHGVADYITVNLSSPNTPGLRSLQAGQALMALLGRLLAERDALLAHRDKPLPILVKIAPDLEPDALAELVDTLLECRIDGVIATNTTLSRVGVEGARHAEEGGGLSGAPLRERSTRVIADIRKHAGPGLPIIGLGGILSGDDALEKVEAGADLVQLYTGFIYRGPGLVRETARALRDRTRA
jgi:dihydroorotate dehydrogenase